MSAFIQPMKLKPPTPEQWTAILEAIGPTGVQPAEHLPTWIRQQRQSQAMLQDTVQKHNLGLGGEQVDKLLCDSFDEAVAMLTKERAALALFLVPHRSHLAETWLEHFEESGAVQFNEIGQVFPTPVQFGPNRKSKI